MRNLLLGVFGELLERSPLREKFGGVFNFLVALISVHCEEFEGLVELVKHKSDLFLLVLHKLNLVLHGEERFHVSQVLILVVRALRSLLHESLHLLDFLLDSLDHGLADKRVGVGFGVSFEGCGVGGSSKGEPLVRLVLVLDRDVNLAFLGDCVAHEVLTVLGVLNFVGNLLRLLFARLDHDFEVVATGGTILLVLVTSLNDEFGLLVEAVSFLDSGTVTQRFLCLSVKEEAERNVGGGKIAALDGQLNDGFSLVTEGSEVGREGRHFSLGDELAGHVDRVLADRLGRLVSRSEVHLDVHLLEANTLDSDGNST